MTQTRYKITTKGNRTIVHRIGRAVGPIVRGTSFGSAEKEAASRRESSAMPSHAKRKVRRSKD
jgi:hypothetical protein